ncbi:MAG TPA: FAD-dependent oxidoreductase [Nocardioidaceae bacterium]|nr:FAD-dependent oxidoreductase [Nocardioidaceae bacterium]
MARVVVVGGGLGGMASAARLAKIGHDVTIVEQLPTLGGALGFIEQDGFRWDSGPSATTLPAALRDLFRKSGRPLERETDLVELPILREHRFDDGSRVAVPANSRAAQRDAFDEGLGAGMGDRWLEWTDGFAHVWELLRKEYLERPYSPDHAPKEMVSLMRDRPTLQRAVNKLRDDRLKKIALHHAVSGGHDPRNVPWWMGFIDHVEQVFGSWTVPGGLGAFAGLLEKRLGERGVTVLTNMTVVELVDAGVRTDKDDVIPADIVVVAIDPRQLPSLKSYVDKTMPAIPPTVCHVGLEGDLPQLPHELVLHGDATITITTGGQAPEGHAAWTISARGRLSEDILNALARAKIDLRSHVVTRVDRSPRQQVEHYRGSSYGVLWQGRATITGQLLTRTPVPNVYAVGAHTTVSALTPFVALTSSLVADAVGPAAR